MKTSNLIRGAVRRRLLRLVRFLCFWRYRKWLVEAEEANELHCKLSVKKAQELRDAWIIINVLNMAELDRGESWPRANQWLKRNEIYGPNAIGQSLSTD